MRAYGSILKITAFQGVTFFLCITEVEPISKLKNSYFNPWNDQSKSLFVEKNEKFRSGTGVDKWTQGGLRQDKRCLNGTSFLESTKVMSQESVQRPTRISSFTFVFKTIGTFITLITEQNPLPSALAFVVVWTTGTCQRRSSWEVVAMVKKNVILKMRPSATW